MSALDLRGRLSHPALAGLGAKVGRRLPGRCPNSAAWMAGYNAALTAACIYGASVLDQPVPCGLEQAYCDGWASGLALARALGVRP